MDGISLHKRLPGLAGVVIVLALISCQKRESLFENLPAEETGITFSNDVAQNDSINIIDYTNMFNGGGVAVADFNNDGLQDLYFTGNMVANELYLNQGDLRFRNVTEAAGVGAEDRWSSGVAAVDINSDGLMDLYVCATTYEDPERRTNLFYINQGINEQGIPVFRDRAREYQVADEGHTTMAAFFDYDRDGDLDLFLIQNRFDRDNAMDRFHKKMLMGEAETTDRLYRNEGIGSEGHPLFTDVSKEAGILIEGFGLGLNIADINQDGWKDIQIANDFITNDVLYINSGDGTFTDKAGEIFKHTAHSAMGSDIADVNNDGRPDVLVVDMRPGDNYRKKKMLQPNDYSAYHNNEKYNYDYQYVRNTLQIHQGRHPDTGQPVYSDIGIWSGIAETDWSWTPLMADFDNDGWRDIVITNGFPNDLTDHDFVEYFQLYPEFVSLEDLLDRMPSVKISNYMYRNNGDLTFADVTDQWGLDMPSFSNGAVQADFDNDGDLDLVVNNINEPALVFQNRLAERHSEKNNYLRVRLAGNAGNTMGLGALLEMEYGDGKRQFHEHSTYRGYLSSVEPVIHFGLGDSVTIDKLTIIWPDSSLQVLRDISPNQVLTLRQEDASPTQIEPAEATVSREVLFRNITGESGINYRHREWDFNDFNIQPLLPHKLSQYGPGLSVGDANGDGLDDLYLSGAFEYEGAFLVQAQDGTFTRKDLLKGTEAGNREEELGSLFFDADGDGDDDLYIVSGGYEHPFGDPAYQDRLFINEKGRLVLEEEALPGYFLASGSAVRAADFDRDGDLDLFVGGRLYPHEYPRPVDSYLLENRSRDGDVKYEIVNGRKAPALENIGMVSDALWTDFDNDGWVDLILAGEWMPIRFLKNDQGRLIEVTKTTGMAGYKGWWNSLCAGDFDDDGDSDYIAGNLGTNTYNRATPQYPLRIYGNDFDKDGNYDLIPTLYYEDREGEKKEVPYHGRRDLGDQIPSLFDRFDSYHSYANATIAEVLSMYDTTGTLVYEATHMKTSYIENRGEGAFVISPMPGKVQWSPVFGCLAEDVNSDGNLDLMLVGNDYGTEVSLGRYDAFNGLTLLGNGNGTFNILDFEDSGFFVPGDAKAVVKLRGAGGSYLMAASQNRGPLKLFRTLRHRPLLQAKPGDASAVIFLEDGSRRKVEFYYGSSFLSASGRFLVIPDNARNIEVLNYRGEKRPINREVVAK